MNPLLILQILVSVVLIVLILIQTPTSTLGSAFGGSSVQHHTRKGAEKLIFTLTIVFAALFILISVINVVS